MLFLPTEWPEKRVVCRERNSLADVAFRMIFQSLVAVPPEGQ